MAAVNLLVSCLTVGTVRPKRVGDAADVRTTASGRESQRRKQYCRALRTFSDESICCFEECFDVAFTHHPAEAERGRIACDWAGNRKTGTFGTVSASVASWHQDCSPDGQGAVHLMLTLMSQPNFWRMKWKIGMLALATFAALC